MDNKISTAIVTVLLAAIGVAIISTLVSQSAKTGSVLGSFGSAIQQMICVALSPVTGKSCGATSQSTVSQTCVPRQCPSDSTWNQTSCACEQIQTSITF